MQIVLEYVRRIHGHVLCTIYVCLRSVNHHRLLFPLFFFSFIVVFPICLVCRSAKSSKARLQNESLVILLVSSFTPYSRVFHENGSSLSIATPICRQEALEREIWDFYALRSSVIHIRLLSVKVRESLRARIIVEFIGTSRHVQLLKRFSFAESRGIQELNIKRQKNACKKKQNSSRNNSLNELNSVSI